ncbi:MAG: serine/threonine-protein kinase, partial [Planctomycetota bacterium]|nr:serine/threonine-protein kinase [Planctomycetota bacterium]
LPGFRIKRAIDRGGFGEVYYAVTDSGKEVALKLLQRNEQVELRGVTQCLNLEHPNLVPIYDIRTDAEGNHWVVMEYVAGKSLERVLEENPKGLPLAEVEIWLQGIAQGIAFLHDRGIVHRDLKPANVFREGGHVKIGDVGLCKFITPSRRSVQTESVGTVYYMAPEVAKGRYRSELDIYSLGIILYEMITGKVPFDGESTGEILMKHLTERPDLSKLPAPFRSAIGKALEKDPQYRTPNALVLAQEFSMALKQQNVGGPSVAVEIPESHFVDVERLERQYAGRPPEPPPVTYGQPTSSGGTATQTGGAPKGFWESFQHELKHNPLFLIAVIVTAVTVVPVVAMPVLLAGRSFGRVMPLFAMWGAIGYLVYWVIKGRNKTKEPPKVRAPVPPRPASYRAGEPRPQGGRPHGGPVPVAVRVSSPPPPPQAPVRRAVKKPKPVVYGPDTPREISTRSRIGNLSTSMASVGIWSAVVTAIVAGFSNWVGEIPHTSQIFNDPARVGLFGLTTVIASWVVMLPTKIWEGREVGGWSRRLVMLALGGGVGAIAWWLNDTLMTGLRPEAVFPNSIFTRIGHYPLLEQGGALSMAGFAAYFAALLGFIRWRLQADSFRSKRLRAFALLLTAGTAWLLPALFVFNQTWGVCWGAAISAVVQLSAPWIPREQREAVVLAGGAGQQSIAA